MAAPANATATGASAAPWYRLLDRRRWATLFAANLGWLFDGYEIYALILTVGVACCMGTALVFLPALLYVLSMRERTPAEPATLPFEEREAA